MSCIVKEPRVMYQNCATLTFLPITITSKSGEVPFSILFLLIFHLNKFWNATELYICEKYPNFKKRVGGSIPGHEIFPLLDEKIA